MEPITESSTPEQIEAYKKTMTEFINANIDALELQARFEKAKADIMCYRRDGLRAQIEIPQMEAHLQSLQNPTPPPSTSKLELV